MQRWSLRSITTTTCWGRNQMLTEELIGSGRFHEKNGLSHGMVADDGGTWPPILLSWLISYSKNLPIGALVKSTYVRCNALLNKRGREVTIMLASDQVYTKVLNKATEEALRKANTHNVLEFDQRDTQFLIQETIEFWPIGDFMVRLDERWCDCSKFQKLHKPYSHVVVACKHVHREYKNYMHLVYTLECFSNVYRGLFGELCNKA